MLQITEITRNTETIFQDSLATIQKTSFEVHSPERVLTTDLFILHLFLKENGVTDLKQDTRAVFFCIYLVLSFIPNLMYNTAMCTYVI